MAKTKTMIFTIVALVAALVIPGSALATNSHQAHRGACATATKSISKGVGDLRANGVATKVGKKFGLKTVDGSMTAQLKQFMIFGRVAKATKTKNHGCDGHGGIFPAGSKWLPVGTPVALVPPPSLGKDLCSHPSSKCKSFIITVKLVLPWSCWNPNGGKIKVKIWIRKDKVPPIKPKPPTVTPPPPGSGCSINIGGDNNGVVGCNVVVYCTINGKQHTDSSVCSNYENCVAHQGYTWNSTQNVCVPPPPPPNCEQTNTCPKSVLITSVIDLNDVPAGLNSGPMPLTVYASHAGASLKVDPGIGKISTCGSSTQLATLTITGLQAGENDLCVVFYAPTDAAATQATITYTAMLAGATPSVRQVTFAITHPTRPQ